SFWTSLDYVWLSVAAVGLIAAFVDSDKLLAGIEADSTLLDAEGEYNLLVERINRSEETFRIVAFNLGYDAPSFDYREWYQEPEDSSPAQVFRAGSAWLSIVADSLARGREEMS